MMNESGFEYTTGADDSGGMIIQWVTYEPNGFEVKRVNTEGSVRWGEEAS